MCRINASSAGHQVTVAARYRLCVFNLEGCRLMPNNLSKWWLVWVLLVNTMAAFQIAYFFSLLVVRIAATPTKLGHMGNWGIQQEITLFITFVVPPIPFCGVTRCNVAPAAHRIVGQNSPKACWLPCCENAAGCSTTSWYFLHTEFSILYIGTY